MHHPEDRDRAPRREPEAESTLVPPAGGTGAPRMVGHVLGGRYEIRGVLGRGGMGEVEPLCGRERSGSPQAKSRGNRGIPC